MDKKVEIRDYIIETIKSSEDKGKKLPSENEIANKFDVSRHSVRQIYNELEKMGRLYSVQGLGRFSSNKDIAIELAMNSKSFTDKMKENNISLVTKIICADVVKSKNKKLEILFKDKEVFKLARLRIIEGEKAAIHYSYLSTDKFPNIREEAKTITSITKYYRDKDLNVKYNDKSLLEIEFPTVEDLEILNCNSLVPLLVYQGTLYDENMELVEYTKTKYRSDIFKYYISNK